MAGSTSIEMSPGQILSDLGADTFRKALQRGDALRCARLWMATAHRADDGGVEIEIYCCLDTRHDCWDVEIYYYSVDRAIVALREYERTGNMPEGE
ncbi:hypothetical protein K2Z83_13230 [Oscillochloris sp. ZM17-4]|uniref:hypothetical protein n=1 Tax=Oscillochloris sp. ZM17-4 TaxID=2866714 RepID=UPI001C734FBC|nr:hypothetical protein [Oscillochloris sp. ZM17-4]MBX0328639.1 hypothetical protein [Oscillochloris sp. ZM17-4]